MPIGNPQSTLLSELNRLANGGTYPPVNTMEEAAAARAWAAAENIALTATDTVGVLNEIAGLPRDQWLDYSGVCNYIAGTTNLPAAAALRQVGGEEPLLTPSEPLLLFATPGNESVTLNWAPPANQGGAPVEYYTIIANRPGVAEQVVTTGPVTITGLTNGLSYSFNVYATNVYGSGPWSDSSTPVTPAFIPYPATGTNVYQFPYTVWTSYGQMASEGSAAGIVQYTYWGWGQGYTCASANFAPFSVQSTDGYVNNFYCDAGGTVAIDYSCPVGGFYNPVTGMCVETPVYSWTVPFAYNPWFISAGEGFCFIDLYGLNAISQPGWPQEINTQVTFTVSGITGPYAALNGTTITGIASEYSIDNSSGFGSEFETVYQGFGLPEYLSSPETYFPGFTLNWQ